jgi:hypothetical protein
MHCRENFGQLNKGSTNPYTTLKNHPPLYTPLLFSILPFPAPASLKYQTGVYTSPQPFLSLTLLESDSFMARFLSKRIGEYAGVFRKRCVL